MTTILQCVQEACKRTGLPSPATAVSNTDENVITMLRFLEKAGKDLCGASPWPELNKEFTFDLVSGQAAYPLPDDFDYGIFETLWDRDNTWPLIGPLTPEEWQYRKSGISTVSPRTRFRVKGWTANKFFVHPTPGTDEAGDTLVLEFQSTNWIRPTTVWSASLWTGSLGSGSLDYVYYGNNIYSKVSGTTTGSTAPTHSIGSASDGGVTWAYAQYNSILADTDVVLLDEELLIEGARWRFKREKGLDYQEIKAECEAALGETSTNLKGAQTVGFARRSRGPILLTPYSIPDSGYGS